MTAANRSQSRTSKVLQLASGRALSNLTVIVGAAVLSRLLSVGEYGTYRQTMLSYEFVAPLLALGLPQALYCFLPTETKRVRGVLVDNLLLLVLMGAAFSAFLLAGGGNLLAIRFHNPELTDTLRLIAPYPLLALPVTAASACLVARERVGQLAVLNVASQAVTLGILVLAVLWSRTVGRRTRSRSNIGLWRSYTRLAPV